MLVKEIRDKVAAVSWSPVPARGNYLALGTKEGGLGGFDDMGGELEIARLDGSTGRDLSMATVASVKTK